MPQETGFLTPRQAAERLTAAGLSVTGPTVQRWCRKNLIPRTETPGGHYRIPVEALDAILTTPPVEPAEVA
jgi:excisionase family DNA binding protein